jgi:hypothetical protein
MLQTPEYPSPQHHRIVALPGCESIVYAAVTQSRAGSYCLSWTYVRAQFATPCAP